MVKLIIEKHELYFLRPKQILSTLRDKDEIEEKYLPTKDQISSYISYLRKSLVSRFLKNYSDDMEEYLDKNSWDEVLSSGELVCLGKNLKPENFFIILSSKKLLQNIINQKNATGTTFAHVDCTYKLLANGFNLLTMGTENSSHNFRFLACCISSQETTSSYENFISTVQSALQKYFAFEWNPNYIISDAADSIHNAVSNIFPQCIHIRCFFHTLKAIKDKISRWKVPNEKKKLKDDWGLISHNVKLLHRSRTEENFVDLWNLVQQQWEKKYPQEFINYFKKNFIETRKKLEWVRKELVGLNFTNNGLERLHGDLKQTYTDRKKLPLNEFLYKTLRRFIRDCSLDHVDSFANLAEPQIIVWRKALYLLKEKERGPFFEIRENYALFIKKKRSIDVFEERKRYEN